MRAASGGPASSLLLALLAGRDRAAGSASDGATMQAPAKVTPID
jgi:hypothetical protein